MTRQIGLIALIAFSLISTVSAESIEPMRCNDLPSYHLYHPDAGQWFDRTTLKPVGNGAVRQFIEISSDAGNTRETTFDAIYRTASSD